MFQYLEDQEIEDIEEENINTKKKKFDFKKLFSISDIILYLVSFMASTVSFGGEFAPFGLAIFAAACSNKIPAGIIYICSVVGTFIGFGAKGLLEFLLTSLVFIAITLIFKSRYEEPERNEKIKLGKFVFISTFAIQVGKMIFGMFLWYDLLASVVYGLLTYIFYKIFANSLTVIKEFGNKDAFTVEEVMGASLFTAIALYSLSFINLWGLSVSNILSIMLVLFLGWKNGMLIGATSGVTIGMVLGIIGSNSPILVAAYAVSGMFAGILSKLGKIGVIAGFVLGNAVLTYFANGNTVAIITIREILIASLGLLLIPKNVDINIEDIIGKTKFLPVTGGLLEGEKEETVEKLNTVSDTISEIAKSYIEVVPEKKTDEELLAEEIKYFKEEFLNNLDDLEDNMLYDDILEADEELLDAIYEILQNKEEISKEEFLEVLEENNNYIIGLDDPKLVEDISKLVKTINYTYKINKLNIVWKQKEVNNKKILANQLGGVSKVISSLAENIENKEESEEEKEVKFKLKVASVAVTKNNSEVSGDSNLQIKLNDGKYMMALSDGMGSGQRAKKSSSTVIKMLKKLLTSGFDKEVSIGLINSSINLNSDEETYATIDISVIDLESGNIEFIKNGACPTFIKSANKVEVVKAISLPAGIVENIDLVIYDKDLKGGEIIVMCTDGILESNKELINKEIWVKELLENIDSEDIQEIADKLVKEAIENGNGIAKDDITILIAKIEKN